MHQTVGLVAGTFVEPEASGAGPALPTQSVLGRMRSCTQHGTSTVRTSGTSPKDIAGRVRGGQRKMSCPGRRDRTVKVAGTPRRTALQGTRGLRPRGRPIESEVPTVVHGKRCAARRAADVRLLASARLDRGVVIA